MRRAIFCLLLLAPMLVPLGSRAGSPCPVPDHLALHNLVLPLVRLAVANGSLTILVLGGAPMAGTAAGDAKATLPSRLEAELTTALPKVDVRVVNASIPRTTAETTVPRMAELIRETGAKLVIWATGAREAALGLDVEPFTAALQDGIEAVHNAGADLILVDMQYAPSIARITNYGPFRAALIGTAAANDVAVLARHEMMIYWNDNGMLDLDAREPEARKLVARRLFSCLATALAGPIAAAAR